MKKFLSYLIVLAIGIAIGILVLPMFRAKNQVPRYQYSSNSAISVTKLVVRRPVVSIFLSRK